MGQKPSSPALSEEELSALIKQVHELCAPGNVVYRIKNGGITYRDEKKVTSPLKLFTLNDVILAVKLAITANLGSDVDTKSIPHEGIPSWFNPDLSLSSTLKDTFGLKLITEIHRENGTHCFLACNFDIDAKRGVPRRGDLKEPRLIEFKGEPRPSEIFEDAAKVKHEDIEAHAVMERKSRPQVWVVIRSSSFDGDWKEHFKIGSVPFEVDHFNCTAWPTSPVLVHEELYNSFLAVKDEIVATIEPLLQNYRAITLNVVGHSMGGAIGTLIAVYLARVLPFRDSRRKHILQHWAIGSPRVGNIHFRKLYDRTVLQLPRVRSFRLASDKDVVPLLPFDPTYVHCGWRALLHSKGVSFKATIHSKFQETLDGLVLPNEVMRDHSARSYLEQLESLRHAVRRAIRMRERGDEAMEASQWDQAVIEYSEGLKWHDQDYPLYFHRAKAHIQLKHYANALSDIDTAVKLDPTSAEAFLRKGEIHQLRYESKHAIECFKRVLVLSPHHSEAVRLLAASKSLPKPHHGESYAVGPATDSVAASTARGGIAHKWSISVSGKGRIGAWTSMDAPSKDIEMAEIKEDVDFDEKTEIGHKRGISRLSYSPTPESKTRRGPKRVSSALHFSRPSAYDRIGTPLQDEMSPIRQSAEIRPSFYQRESRMKSELHLLDDDESRSSQRLSMEEKEFDLDHKGLTLYMGQFCPFSQRCEIALREKGLEFKKCYVRSGQSAPKWFLKLAPNGKAPVLRHDQHVVADSHAILLYLEETFPKPHLLPTDEEERKNLLNRISESGKFMLSFAKFLFCKNPRELPRYKAEFAAHLDAHEHAIAGIFFAGDDLTLIDIALWTIYHRFSALKHYKRFELSKVTYGRLHSWLATLENREAFKMAKFGDDGGGETGSFIKSLERKARSGPLDFVLIVNNAIGRSLELLQERLTNLSSAAKDEEIHDIELESISKDFDQLFALLVIQRKCKKFVLFPYFESIRKNIETGITPILIPQVNPDALPASAKDPYDCIDESLNRLKSHLGSLKEGKSDRKINASHISSSVHKLALAIDDVIDEEEKVIYEFVLNQSWEEQGRLLQALFQSLLEAEVHLLIVWSFKHALDKTARLQLLRPLAFSFGPAQYQQYTEWLEMEAGIEYTRLSSQAKRLVTRSASDAKLERSASSSSGVGSSISSPAVSSGASPSPLPVSPSSIPSSFPAISHSASKESPVLSKPPSSS